ncbi:hypothetical protein QFZ77_003201 [Paenibacillus sp. V4I3]|uniref:OmpL47-type beta-barrel domain-containing protein n=1 Tax=Paenibacillus sp. V4I3 TaxID=3042305 RepID=UPI0027838F0E|nr:discoidin domain-containing protein [Paenibacillus sp. V4I3]MDQ0874542.1 hypothetical protein [Paenibacillus sp. V4I3]
MRKISFHLGILWKRLLAVVAVVNMLATLMPISTAAAADETVSTGYQVEINETITSGFTHPGVGLTKATLENMRAEVLAQKEPWYSYYKAMTVSSTSSTTITSSNQSSTDPTKPAVTSFDSQGFNQRFIQDALKAYTQTLMYYVTGDEVYRANAMRIIRIWSQMDPTKYVYFTDAHIHTGIPLNRMVTAAEILRYSSYQTEELKWTDKDTADFTANLITPVIETFQHENNHFMNQHNYPLLGAMAGYIFTENRERYNEAVEWATVNKTAVNQGFNGSIKQLFRLIDTNAATGEKLDKPVVQQVEMGRDQAHGAGDLTNSAFLSRLFLAQGTKVDPVEGTVSTQANAVGYYEFLDDRFLAAADFFWKYMLGYDTPWVPVAYSTYPDGTVRGIYQKFSDSYRGRTNTALFWDMYYYYTYVKGINVAEKAPYLYDAFTKRSPSNYYYKGALTQAWESVDGGGDFWLYMPKAAESEGAKYLPKEQTSAALVEVEDRYTAFDNNTATKQEGDTSYVEFTATAQGSEIAVQNLSYADRTNSRLIGLKFRTGGPATLELSNGVAAPYYTLALPDTQGQWKYVTYDMGISQVSYGQLDGDYSLVYMNVKGDGTTVDFDHFNVQAGTGLTPPSFKAGNSDLNIFAFVGSPLTLDFSATDSGTTDTVAYQSGNKPEGADLNANTGAFSWQPTQAGAYSFIVEASDGTTIATKKANIVVGSDRASAVQAAIAPYNPNTSYVSGSLNNFNTVYNNTIGQIQTASDSAFSQQLITLRSAVESLQLLTPSLQADGSMAYTNMITSTFGNSISLLVDGNNNTFPVYTLAPYPNLYHILDFGPDYKLTADAFAMQGRMNFVDRMAGMTVFGSNDKENWTRITPEQTAFTDGFSKLDVADAYKNEKFRFIKLEMIDPQPDVLRGNIQNLLELSELRIYGERHEINNKLESISIGSDKSVNGRIVLGSTVKLTIKAKEAINNVSVKIQGQDAAVSTQDNINFTALATLNENVQTGIVKFTIDYKKNDGTNGDTTYFTTDNSKLYLADESDLIRNVASITNLIDSTTSSGRTAAETLKQTNYLFDNDLSTSSDYRLNGGGSGSYITFDFKEGNQTVLSSVELLARQDNNLYSRIRGAVVQGSNDNATWTTLSKAATSTIDWQTLAISGTESYRYIRILNSNGWFGNMAELRFHGVVKSLSKIESASMSSDQNLNKRIVPGNTVKLTIKSKEAINNVKVAIQGQDATVTTQDNINFTAVATLNQGAAAGPVKFTINYKQQDGADGFPITTTSDNTTLFLADESDLISNVASIANLIDSTSGRTAATTLQQVNYLFDSNLSTSSDFRLGSSSGTGSYITFDFKAGNQAMLSSVELLGRQDQNLFTRINGAVVQGSNDNTTWTALTKAAVSTADWQSFAISSKVPYRYIRIYNPTGWFGNMAELRLHGAVKAADLTPPVTTDDAPQGSVNKDTKVSFNATDADSGVASTFFKVDGGAQQTGNSVTLTTEGTHTLVYWSVDSAGNVEQPHTVAVNIDKTAPADATLSADVITPTNSDVTLTIGYPADAAVIEYKVGESGTWTAYGAPVVVSANDTVYARGTDAAGNVNNVTSYEVNNIDHVAPVDAIIAVDTTAPTNQGVTVTINYPADATVKEYKVGESGTWTAYSATVIVSDNETVYARGTDAVGNVSNVTSMTVSNIYKIAPVTTATLSPAAPNGNNSWYTTDVSVNLSVSANVYGGAVTTEYQVNDGAWITYTGSIPAFGEGSYKFGYRSTDQAGNVEQLKTVEFKVDKTQPSLIVQLDKTSIWPAEHKMVTINATLNSSDAVSGVESVVLTSITSNQPDSGQGDIQANFGTAATSFSLRAEKSRIYTITYTATDKAGNKTVTSVTVTVPHDQSDTQ